MDRSKQIRKGIFITATDTGVGKTVASAVLGTLLQKRGVNVGLMKPVQCGGGDAQFLKHALNIKDDLTKLNPYFAKEPLSPHLAFRRAGITINKDKIIENFNALCARHDFVIVEGAGGLLVPITKNYFMADLAKDLGLDVIIVTRLGLGTINHTLVTINQARSKGLNVVGIIFNNSDNKFHGLPEKNNPETISMLGKVDILGEIPYMKEITKETIEKKCRLDLKKIISETVQDKTKQLIEWDKEYVWHPFTQMQDWLKDEPLVINRAEGCYLIDSQGNKYLDGVSSLWVNVHGHRNSKIDTALKAQIDKLSHSTMLGLSNTPAIELAKSLVEIAPKGLEKVFYSDSGSTAVEVALKIAYQYWQNIGETKKRKIVHLANSYHGDTLGSVSVGGIDLFHKVYRDLVFETISVDFPDCYRAPKGEKYPNYAFKFVDRFEKLIKKEAQNIAAFIVEPIVQGAAGMIIWPKGILKRMSEICRKHDVIFIADEVATGFGRTGKMFASEHENVIPDIMCLAKGLTGGYLPLAATLTTKKIFDGFLFPYKDQKTFFHGHTYTGNPLACAAAITNLDLFKEEKTILKLQPKIKFLEKELKKFKALQHVGDVRQKGFMAGIELVKDKATKEPFPWQDKIGIHVCQEVRKYGVILRPLGNVIVLMPPLVITKAELKIILDSTYKAIEKITNG